MLRPMHRDVLRTCLDAARHMGSQGLSDLSAPMPIKDAKAHGVRETHMAAVRVAAVLAAVVAQVVVHVTPMRLKRHSKGKVLHAVASTHVCGQTHFHTLGHKVATRGVTACRGLGRGDSVGCMAVPMHAARRMGYAAVMGRMGWRLGWCRMARCCCCPCDGCCWGKSDWRWCSCCCMLRGMLGFILHILWVLICSLGSLGATGGHCLVIVPAQCQHGLDAPARWVWALCMRRRAGLGPLSIPMRTIQGL